ncbi:MAG TPA: 3-isopropylmalate dehydratase [Verrucomicrobiae bacterium]|nr:3-isopropylmalate dehydratase [Verrucomicrobiae bacterium]
MSKVIRGKAFVVRDNIDTDQIIPAQYLTLVPTIPEEYEKLGSYALRGLPKDQYPTRYVPEGATKTPYTIVVGGRNFGCGSSREHAPIALGAAGCKAVVAETFARIFFRNSVATGELYPVESTTRICETIRTGDEVELDLDANTLKVLSSSRVLATKSLGEARPVIDAGGIFNFARKTGMIKARGKASAATAKLAAKEPADD